nr:MAG TPA: hypothetical protein [Caudoviricetes sp.]
MFFFSVGEYLCRRKRYSRADYYPRLLFVPVHNLCTR